MTDISSDGSELPFDNAHAVIAEGARRMERLLLDKLIDGRHRSIKLTRSEAECMVSALGEIAAIEAEMDADLSQALEST